MRTDHFGVDHYKPRVPFRALSTVYSNLFYSCNTCNRRKGTYWPQTTAAERLRFVPNPCDHVMFDHLRFVDEKIVAHSPPGEFALELLMLNDDEWLRFRAFARAGLSAVLKELSEARILLSDVEKRIDSASPAEKATLESQLDSLRQEISRLEVNLGNCHLQI